MTAEADRYLEMGSKSPILLGQPFYCAKATQPTNSFLVLSAEWVVEGASQKAKCTGGSKKRSVKAAASNPEP